MKDAAAKVRKGEFTLDDFLNQLKQVRKLGSFQSILGMLPGMGKFKDQLKDIDLDADKEMNTYEHHPLHDSARACECEDPEWQPPQANRARRRRKIQDVNRMMKQFADMQKTMKEK